MSSVDNPLILYLQEIISARLAYYHIDVLAWQNNLIHWSETIWYFCLFLTLIFFVGVIYFSSKVSTVRRFEHERVYGQQNIVQEIKEELKIVPPKQNKDWEKIQKLIGSDNPNDWKLAIIEADKMLEIVVKTFSVLGDNLGEKMKNIEKGDFLTLDEAWQAHKVRNRIAHEHNFHLSQREARQAIDNFGKVFREFDFI